MTSYKRIAISALLLAMSGCGQLTSKTAGDVSQPVIQGEVTPTSYDHAVKETLEHAISLITSETPTDQELDVDVGKIEQLLALAQEKDVDKERTHEAALLSTEGSLYAVKARINQNSPRLTGEFISKSFRYLDKAIALHPQDLNARINRGIVSSKVPDFLGKAQVAHEDLLFARDNADFERLSPQLQDTIKRDLAEVDSRLANSDHGQ
jgi:hypothetical protein